MAHRVKRHENEWCDSPQIVELRGLALKSRKLRHYDRTWCLAEADDGSGDEGDGDEETKSPREYVSVRKDPFTLEKMGIDPNELDLEEKGTLEANIP